ncbi:PIN domain-containing protein [Wenzhouxiangella sp. EGI_FJ10409]|uniref:PIN domain-containing protein n=1 Tax=Wenzhouxiangella sp. EGI_FJ10409 TaxID=3243767 RepID=UPI0035D6DAFF
MAETRAYFDTSVIAPLYRAEPLTTTAEALQQRSTSLRTLDALHLAIAAENGWPIITADKKLQESAEALGCKNHLAQPDQAL